MVNLDSIQLTASETQQKNLEVAQRINRETRANVASPYTGKYIGVWHQEVVAVGDALDEVSRQLDALGDKNFEGVCIQASVDYDKPIRIASFFSLTMIDNWEQHESCR